MTSETFQFHKLPETRLQISRISFGTSTLHHLPSSRKRRALLDAAVSAGITHFDTAPLYGFGLAERTLAPLLAACPRLTVATKVGLYPPGGAQQSLLGVTMRKALGRFSPALSRAQADFSVRTAEASLTASLQRLGRERIDLLLLHEPESAMIVTEEWRSWLESERSRGRVAAIGVAGTRSAVAPFVASESPLAEVVQTADSLRDREANFLLEAGRPLQITYGYLSAVRREAREVDAGDILRGALERNPTGSVLVSTRQCERLKTVARVLATISV